MTREVPRPGEIAVKARFENGRFHTMNQIALVEVREEMSKHILFANLINTEKKFLDPYCRYDTRGSSETNNFTIVREPCITR